MRRSLVRLRQQLLKHTRDPTVPRRTVMLPVHIEFPEELGGSSVLFLNFTTPLP